MLGIVGFLGSYLDNNFSKESRITIMIMVIGTSLFYEIGYYLLNHFVNAIYIELKVLMKIITIEILYNVILTIIIYPVLKGIGYRIEEIFKGSNILTRYF